MRKAWKVIPVLANAKKMLLLKKAAPSVVPVSAPAEIYKCDFSFKPLHYLVLEKF